MEQETLDFLNTKGSLYEVAGNKPFLLDDPNQAWVVLSGKVNVFAVRIVDGRPRGSRKFMFSVDAEEAMWGIDAKQVNNGFGLLAVASGKTQLYKLKNAHLQSYAADSDGHHDMVRWLSGFVECVSSVVARHDHPQFQVLLVPAEIQSIEAGQIVSAQEELVWVRHQKGHSFFAGVRGLSITPDNMFFPVSQVFWLVSAEEMQLSVLNTSEYLTKDLTWRGFTGFLEMFLEWIAHDAKQGEAAEQRRLMLKTQADRHYQETALKGLASLMNPEMMDGLEGDRADPVFAACQAIGREMNITFQQAPGWQTQTLVSDRLQAICQASGVGCRRVSLSEVWWTTDSGPLLCIVDREDSKPAESVQNVMVALPTVPGHYKLLNPVDQTTRPVDAEVALEPFAYVLYRPFPNKILTLVDLGRFAWHDLKWDLKTLALTSLAGVMLGLVIPLAAGYLFNTVIPQANMESLWMMVVGLVVIALAGTLFELARGFTLLRIETKSTASLQMAMIDRTIRLPIPFYRDYSAGDLVDRLNGVNTIRQIVGGATILSVLNGLVSAGNFALLFYFSVPLALVAVGILALSIAFIGICAYFRLYYERQLLNISGKLSGLVLQLIGGVAKLRVSGTEARAFAIWADGFKAQKQFAFHARRWENYVRVYNTMISVVSALLVFAAFLFFDLDAKLSTGDFIAFYVAFGIFMTAGTTLANTFVHLIDVVPLLERGKPILETLPEMDAARPAPGVLQGRIEFNHISFRYQQDSPLILNDVSFQVEPGEFVALVGPSGGGKSTLLRLLLGFETPESGSVYYDAQELASIDIPAVRRQIGAVLQNTKLLSGDILSNIVGATSMTIDDAWEAARMAGMEEDIKQMPMGMHTFVGAGGGTLSGGQRQRLLIAQALVNRPRIVFFDEATSALDNRTQQMVGESLEQLHATRIVVAHRISTIRNADRIYVLDRGEIVQSGTYEALQAQDGLFAELVARQELA